MHLPEPDSAKASLILSLIHISVIVVSSELPEVMGISDRILVMREGTIAGEVAQKNADEEMLVRLAMNGVAAS